MSDPDVPGEGDGFGRAFDGDGADAGAVADVFDGDELGLRRAVGTVEADGGGVVGSAEARAVELVAQGRGQHGVCLWVGVEVVADAAFPVLLRAREDGAADLEGEAPAEAGRRLLLDALDAHPAADLRVAERAVDERLDERLVVDAQEPVRAARELYRPAARATLVEPAQRVEAEPVVEVIRPEPLVEGAGQVVLVVERDRSLVSRQVEMQSHVRRGSEDSRGGRRRALPCSMWKRRLQVAK